MFGDSDSDSDATPVPTNPWQKFGSTLKKSKNQKRTTTKGR